jgi:hypothetical protein
MAGWSPFFYESEPALEAVEEHSPCLMLLISGTRDLFFKLKNLKASCKISPLSSFCTAGPKCMGFKFSLGSFRCVVKEKVHSTTLVYKRCLSFNPQPQNQVFGTHELSKPSDLHPSVVFAVFFRLRGTVGSTCRNPRHHLLPLSLVSPRWLPVGGAHPDLEAVVRLLRLCAVPYPRALSSKRAELMQSPPR